MNADYVINCDGFSPLYDLAFTRRTEEDAAGQLISPLAGSDITVIDLNIGSTGRHICRTGRGIGYSPDELRGRARRSIARRIIGLDRAAAERVIAAHAAQAEGLAQTISHYNRQPLDLLDVVVKHGHASGLKVHAGLRLNNATNPAYMREVPGPGHHGGMRKDFRSREFQVYLLNVYAELLDRGVDGLTLDFERKAPFFPEEAPQDERFEACTAFVRAVRGLNPDCLAARVAFQPGKGEPQGQEPIKWMLDGLLDAVIPATHNHEPDNLDWGIERFVAAASRSPRYCRVWPQIWPAAGKWTHPGFRDDAPERWHNPEAVLRRARSLLEAGAAGVYFFNFFPWPENGRVVQRSVEALKHLP